MRTRIVAGLRVVSASGLLAVLAGEAGAQVRRGFSERTVGRGGRVLELVDWEDGRPLYLTTTNINAAISTGTNLLRPAPFSLAGSGVVIGVWDGAGCSSFPPPTAPWPVREGGMWTR